MSNQAKVGFSGKLNPNSITPLRTDIYTKKQPSLQGLVRMTV